MSHIVCHKVDIGEQNLAVGEALRHAGVCIWEQQHDHIQHQKYDIPADMFDAKAPKPSNEILHFLRID